MKEVGKERNKETERQTDRKTDRQQIRLADSHIPVDRWTYQRGGDFHFHRQLF